MAACDVPRLDSLRAKPRAVAAVSVAPDTTVTHNRGTPSTFQAWKRTKVNRKREAPKRGVNPLLESIRGLVIVVLS